MRHCDESNLFLPPNLDDKYAQQMLAVVHATRRAERALVERFQFVRLDGCLVLVQVCQRILGTVVMGVVIRVCGGHWCLES